MPDDILPFDKTKDPALSRRTFGALSLGAPHDFRHGRGVNRRNRRCH